MSKSKLDIGYLKMLSELRAILVVSSGSEFPPLHLCITISARCHHWSIRRFAEPNE